MELSPDIKAALIEFQRNEITEYHVYSRLAKKASDSNKKLLEKIALDENNHYERLKEISGTEVKPNRILVFWYLFLAKVLGMTFALKLMEQNEQRAEESYSRIVSKVEEAREILQEEFEHENALVQMIDEERINYIGSMVLGLNDALVELTGALAGLTLALRNTRLIAIAGLITGLAASLSMAASEYLSTKSESTNRDPIRASIYTGFIYALTVVVLVLPYFIITGYFTALAITLLLATLVVLAFSFFVSVVQDKSFSKLFLEMLLISFGVAFVTFLIGFALRKIFNIEV